MHTPVRPERLISPERIHPMNNIRNNLGQSISFITLGVSDVQQSREFYRKMGFTEDHRSNEHVVFYDLGGHFLALFSRHALAEDAGMPSAPEHHGLASSLSHNVRNASEIDSILQLAEASGGVILKKASTPPWGGMRGYFADPDGFAWEVAWNPAFDFGPDDATED